MVNRSSSSPQPHRGRPRRLSYDPEGYVTDAFTVREIVEANHRHDRQHLPDWMVPAPPGFNRFLDNDALDKIVRPYLARLRHSLILTRSLMAHNGL